MHFYSVKNRPKIPIFSTFINNEILRNFEGKNHGLVHGILEELLYLSKKNPAWAIKKQPVERGKREVHFRCVCIKC